MRPRLVVVGQVLLQHPPQVFLVQHDDMIEAFPPDRADYSLAVSVLPWRPGGGDDLLNAQDFQSIDNFRTVGAIPIPDQIPRSGIEGKRLEQLQTCLVGGGIACDVEVNDAPTVE